MRKQIFVCACLMVFLSAPLNILAQQDGLSIGYGFGTFNNDMRGVQIRDGNYDYGQMTFFHERRLFKRVNWTIEPFVSYINRPTEGVDGGVSIFAKAYVDEKKKHGLFATAGGGSLYTSMGYSGQGTHLWFILQGGLGYRWDKYFVEGRFKHYSNGDTATPNRSLNSSILFVGMYL
ncbi:MAG TPA: acyloxyacyl hydrolase [Syntrophorhabdaceae bacterium]|nr:acyloxyacyl hydrolase [Syntrophorhabdaceae bacterium]